MRKIVSLISLLLICLVFTSCVDYVQSVTFKNGKYHMYYKVTLSKLLFAMADEDPEEIFMDFDEEEIGELPPNISIKPVNTELEVALFEIKNSDEIDPKAAVNEALNLCDEFAEPKEKPFINGMLANFV